MPSPIGIVRISLASISPRSSTRCLQPGGRRRLLAEVEALEPLDAALVAVGDAVEVLLHRGGELVVDEVAEVLLEQARHGEREPRRHERLALGEDVAAVLDRADRRGIRRGAADAALLHRLDERGLGVAGGRARLVAVGLGAHDLERDAGAELGQAALLGGRVGAGGGLVVTALLVRGEEALEGDDRAAGAELDGLRALDGRVDGELDGGGRAAGVGHLRGDGALPDQLVERELLAAQLARRPGPGVRKRSPAGRMASWASCAFLTFFS